MDQQHPSAADAVEQIHARLVKVEDALAGVRVGAAPASIDTVLAIVDDLEHVVRRFVDLIRTPLASAPTPAPTPSVTAPAPPLPPPPPLAQPPSTHP